MPDFSRVLIIDCALPTGHIGLAVDGVVVSDCFMDRERRRAADLTLRIRDLLAPHNVRPTDLSAVVINLGPGSYTGLRVAVATGKAICYATGSQFVGVDGFAAYAAAGGSEIRRLTVVSDALQGKVFHRTYERNTHGDWSPVSAHAIGLAVDIGHEAVTSGTAVAGPAHALIRQHHPHLAVSNLTVTSADLLCVARMMPWATELDLWLAEPLYLRGSSAEEKKAMSAPAS